MSTSTERMRRLRARRAALLEPVDGPPLRDADELLAPAVEETLAALQLAERDAAAAQVARAYASAIDQARDQAYALRWLGPLLLAALTALQATPASRPAGARQPAGPQRVNRIAQQRADFQARQIRRHRGTA